MSKGIIVNATSSVNPYMSCLINDIPLLDSRMGGVKPDKKKIKKKIKYEKSFTY